MSRRKPRGINGIVKLTGGASSAEFIPTPLPDTKEEIERVICAAALRTMRENGWTAWPAGVEPRQLRENDFDFAFDLPDAPEYLDLAELAPLEGVRGGYEGVSATVSRGRLVDAVIRIVRAKAERYGRNRRSRVHLLLYATDFRFLISAGTVLLLKNSLRREHFGFVSVSYCALIDPNAALLHVLFPAPGGVPYLTIADETRMRAETFSNADPRGWRVDPQTGGFFPGFPDEASDRAG